MVFFRLNKLKAYFKYNNMYNPTTEDQLFKLKTNKKWTPDKNYYFTETYVEASKNALETEEQNKNKSKCYSNLTKGETEEQNNNKNKYYNSLTKGERIAKNELADQNDIIFTKADKGGAAVLIDIEDYIKQTEDQLNNKDAYKKPQSYPRQTHARLVNA